jgi:phosphopantothenoylcysteine decarboxylase/phosphopantothenate--cysteine ligase
MSVAGKKILLGVTGGIAAYKSAELVRRLKERGAQVQVVMTQSAQEFVTPLTFQAVSGEPVHSHLLDPEAEAGMGHIELARWADLVLIAPATANTLAKVAHGLADDLLTTVCLARRAPLALVPAMNQAMWANAATQANAGRLSQQGVLVWGPGIGEQACGDVGPGRMLEVADIVAHTEQFFAPASQLLTGKTVVITAGPTREAIDPVRYITNHSSGKMGYSLARAAAAAGAVVHLISGPTALPPPPGVNTVNVLDARDMHREAMTLAPGSDIFIGCAAVADYRPITTAEQKIKKTGDSDRLTLTMTENPDIIAAVARLEARPFTVGFAAETENLAEHAEGKLKRKALDLLIANDVSRTDIGFNADDNEVAVFWPGGQQAMPRLAKEQLAAQLIELIASRLTDAQPLTSC